VPEVFFLATQAGRKPTGAAATQRKGKQAPARPPVEKQREPELAGESRPGQGGERRYSHLFGASGSFFFRVAFSGFAFATFGITPAASGHSATRREGSVAGDGSAWFCRAPA